ncbi:MAG: GNAT family N-acetyltransferase [Bryobacteraceae bacterium]|nr:GNAT family N-acetyltransferase [Bryobacteraceae bacterium]MCX7602923.1 GNAT family N-acetyltransferase [Bryobacteraceae bacterium]
MADVLEIARAMPGDAEWCARLMAGSEPWITLGRGYQDCLARCLHPEYDLLVARAGGVPCGFVLLHPRGLAGSPYIAAIAVDPAWRGRGVGSALVGAAERFYPDARHLFLLVSSFNRGAQRLYARLGFRQVGEIPDYVIAGASELIFHKRLRSS